MFVHIYGSRELFVNEFANLLGDKLLTIKDFNADREVLISITLFLAS
jgi:hypothetical protein